MSKPTLLFTKTGVHGSEPDGFYEAVADEYQAVLFEAEPIRRELGNGRLRYNAQMTQAVRRVSDKRVGALLSDGHDVMYNSFLNARLRQDEVFGKVAKRAGADVVSISMRAPIELAVERLRDRNDRGMLHFNNPREPNIDALITSVQGMGRRVWWPGWKHDIHKVNLDGQKSTEQLIGELGHFVTQLSK